MYELLWGISAYTAACTVGVPLPSQAPVLLYPKVGLFVILLLSGVGRAFGVVALRLLDKRLDLNGRVESVTRRVTRLNWITTFVRRRGPLGMFAIVAVPIFPFRTPLYIVLLARPPILNALVAYVAGCGLRDIIVWLIYRGGLRLVGH